MHNACTKQHALRLLWFASNHIHQPMHPIAQIHINQTAFPIKQLCSFGSAFVSMASLIFFSPIGFCFCNAFLQNRSIRQLPNQQLPHQTGATSKQSREKNLLPVVPSYGFFFLQGLSRGDIQRSLIRENHHARFCTDWLLHIFYKAIIHRHLCGLLCFAIPSGKLCCL